MEGISDGQIIAFTSQPAVDTPSHDTVFWPVCMCTCGCLKKQVEEATRGCSLPEEGHYVTTFMPEGSFFFFLLMLFIQYSYEQRPFFPL